MKPVFYEQRAETIFMGEICDHPFPSHVHDVVEIVCLQTGSMEMTISSKNIMLLPGDIAITFPSEVHSYDYVSKDASGLTLIFLPDTIMEFCHVFRTMQPLHPLLLHQDQAPELTSIIRHLLTITSGSQAAPLMLGYLHLFLAYLFTALPLTPRARNPHSTLTDQVLQYISEHFAEPLTLENTSHALGISRIHLSHIFSQQLHINFRQYINTLRIDRACTLLRNPNYSISQIAYLCGYGNQRTFHRAFLAQCGMPPNQYRAEQPSHPPRRV
ncbi:MAG: AraC family transcriptional regulator [Clostridiales bacterium]|nr:AraC family transcriptional regulator [Clostridiales bacterium]